jgi:DMSO/TMAO reductase YedYZ molybdopterin-dependent catalytic subunit
MILIFRCWVVVLVVVAGVTAVCLTGCAGKEKSPKSGQALVLEPAVIKGFEGKRLGRLCAGGDSAVGGRELEVDSYRLRVTGLVELPKSVTYEGVLDRQHYRKQIRLESADGWVDSAVVEGVLVSDVMADAGIQSGANEVIFYADDGYSWSFPLGYIVDSKVILAYKMDGTLLSPSGGFPFVLVAQTKHGQEWVKWVTRFEVAGDCDSAPQERSG